MIQRFPPTLAVAFALLCAPASVGVAQSSGSMQVTGTVLSAITVTGTDLAFGVVLPTQTKTVAPAAGGKFVLTMQRNAPVSITYSVPSSLGPNVAIANWTGLASFFNNTFLATPVTVVGTGGTQNASSPTGALYIWVGARLSTTGAAAGSYSAPITLTVAYN